MNAALESRIRAAGAEMAKPGRWRIALDQLDQITTQLVTTEETDTHDAQLALEQLQLLYQWASVMSSQDFHRLNRAVMQLSELISSAND